MKGLQLNAAAPNALRFMPAFNVSDDEIDEIGEMFDVLGGSFEVS